MVVVDHGERDFFLLFVLLYIFGFRFVFLDVSDGCSVDGRKKKRKTRSRHNVAKRNTPLGRVNARRGETTRYAHRGGREGGRDDDDDELSTKKK